MSISRSEIKLIRSLQQKKYRKQHGLFVVEGVKPVQELLLSGFPVHRIYSTDVLDFLPIDHTPISSKELERISGMRTPNTVLAVAHIPEDRPPLFCQPLTLLLDGIRDPGNLGTIIRTARWFGVAEILCTPDTVDAYDRKVVQSAMGALFRVSLHYGEAHTFLSMAKQNGFSVMGTDMAGTPIFDMRLDDKVLLVVGSESHGMRSETRTGCDMLCSVPNMEDERTIESLNAAIASGIVMAEISRRKRG